MLLSLTVALFAFGAHAADVKAGNIVVSNVWAPASAGNNAAAYATIKNDGAVADRLIDAATDAAAMAHLHVTIEDNGVMKMRAVDGVEIPAHGSAILAPGNTHIMLMTLTKPLKPGDKFELTLTFKIAGVVKVTALVGKAGATGMDHGSMDHMNMDMPKSGSGQ
jgi:copper(I)-binding protein